MAMGKRKSNRQPRMWIATTDLPTAASHPFYARLNRLFADQRFDDFAETACAPFYAAKMGRPGLPPGDVGFRTYVRGHDNILKRRSLVRSHENRDLYHGLLA